jgi:mRNA-degrading endonuclease toxin of MazEF toxin-antitoxin module
MRLHAGDVVWAPDPYHDDDPDLTGDAGRPWLVLSGASFPRQGSAYVCCALTTTRRKDIELIALPLRDWTQGGPRRPSRIDPQTLLVVKANCILHRLGRVDERVVQRTRQRVVAYLA